MNGIGAFFNKKRLTDEFEIRGGLPDKAILEFPYPIHARPPIQRERCEKTVQTVVFKEVVFNCQGVADG